MSVSAHIALGSHLMSTVMRKHKYCSFLVRYENYSTCLMIYRAGGLVQWLMLPAWKVGDRGFEPRSSIQVSMKLNISSPLTHKDSWLGFRILCVSSYSSHHSHAVPLAQFSLNVHKGDLKPHSFHFICLTIRYLPEGSHFIPRTRAVFSHTTLKGTPLVYLISGFIDYKGRYILLCKTKRR